LSLEISPCKPGEARPKNRRHSKIEKYDEISKSFFEKKNMYDTHSATMDEDYYMA
jgi:hypothetical protein